MLASRICNIEISLMTNFAPRIAEEKVQQSNIPVTVVHLHVLTQQGLLSGLVGVVFPDEVAVLFSLEHGDQVDSGPHLFSGELAERKGVLVSKDSLVCGDIFAGRANGTG